MIHLRAYQPADAPGLLKLFRDTIHRVNARDYSPEQIRAWAPEHLDADRWATRFSGRFAVVAELAGRLAGFADLEDNGHLDRFYVSADHQGQGVGRMLLEAVLTEAHSRGIARVFTEASITARGFFERHGFREIAAQIVVVRGVELVNFRMETRS